MPHVLAKDRGRTTRLCSRRKALSRIKHRAKNCKYKKKCNKCKREHTTCLHEEKVVRDPRQHAEHSTQTSNEKCSEGSWSSTTAVSADAKSSSDQNHVSFFAGVPEGSNTSFIVPVYLTHVSKPDHKELVYTMLDPQSDPTLILNETCARLGMDGIETSLRLSTMSAINQVIYPRKVEGLTVHGLRGSKVVKLPPAFSRQSVPVNKENISTPDTAIKWPHLRPLASEIPPLQADAEVGSLIGNDCPLALSLTSPKDFIPAPESGGPYAQKSVVG